MSLTRALESVSIACTSWFTRPVLLLLTGGWLTLGLMSCNSKKYLLEGESFLRDNKTTIKSKHPVSNKSELQEVLVNSYIQKQTRVLAGIPRHVFYYQYLESIERNPGRKKWDENKIANNKPVIYDSLKALQTTEVFERYLSLRGYRNAIATYRSKTIDKETTVYYKVDPGPRTYIDSFVIVADDPVLQNIIDSFPEPSLIREGDPLDITLYSLEKNRIIQILKNKGYAAFDETFIPNLEVDTAGGFTMARMRVLNPSDSTIHQVHTNGDIIIYPDYDDLQPRTYLDTFYRLIEYRLPDSLHFTLDPDVIDRNLFVRPGNMYRFDDYQKTHRNLAKIQLIEFVKPMLYVDSLSETPKVDYTFRLTRNQKISLQTNVELTYSNFPTMNRRALFGTNFNLDYRDLNTFGGAEVLNFNLESGLEFNLNRTSAEDSLGRDLLNSVNLGSSIGISFPRFMDPLRLYHIIGHQKQEEGKALFGGRLRQWLDQDASTRMSIGYSFVDIQDLYQYYTLNANLSYIMQPDLSRKLTINRIGFDLFLPDPKPTFEKILEENRFQRESFGKQLFSGFIFRDYFFEYNSKSKLRRDYFKIIHSMEQSGMEMLGINLLENSIQQRTRPFGIYSGRGENRDTLEFSHFVRGEIDFRYYYDFSSNTSLAFKFNSGLAVPFGPFTNQVPYLKQFFVGGAYSNRGWQIRELGPGGHEDKTITDPNLPFYQTGDFKIDLSLEFRFKLFWYFHSAVFVDAANVWTLRDAERPEGQLTWDFYKQFGIGYGYGLRLDLDIFILRFDLGYKFYNPYPVKGDHILHDELKKFPGGAEPQLAVGHKF